MQTDTTLSVFASWSDQVATDLRHELTHAYVHSVIPRLPLWLDEGLAEYFEVSPGQGGWHPGHGKWVDDHPLDDLNSLEALSDPAAMAQHHYASSWAWVHFLLHHSGDSRRLLHEHLSQWQQQSEASRLSLAVAQKGWTGEVVRRHVRENSTE